MVDKILHKGFILFCKAWVCVFYAVATETLKRI